jgi:hypothetical protein
LLLSLLYDCHIYYQHRYNFHEYFLLITVIITSFITMIIILFIL